MVPALTHNSQPNSSYRYQATGTEAKSPSRSDFHAADLSVSPEDHSGQADPRIETVHNLQELAQFRPTECYSPEWIAQYPDLPVLVTRFCDLTEITHPLYDSVSNVPRLPDVYAIHLMVYALHLYNALEDEPAANRLFGLLFGGGRDDTVPNSSFCSSTSSSSSSPRPIASLPPKCHQTGRNKAHHLTIILATISPEQMLSWIHNSLGCKAITPDDAKTLLCLNLWAHLLSGLGLPEITSTLSRIVALYRWAFGPDQINSPVMLMFDAVAHLYPRLVKVAQVLSDQLPAEDGRDEEEKMGVPLSRIGKAWAWFLKQLFACNRDVQYYHRLLD